MADALPRHRQDLARLLATVPPSTLVVLRDALGVLARSLGAP
jgi:hypothetical protein